VARTAQQPRIGEGVHPGHRRTRPHPQLGLLRALESGEPTRPWLRTGAAVDALDTVATLAAFGQLPKALRFAVLALGVGGAVTGLRLADALN
jgi:hypothetical protein